MTRPSGGSSDELLEEFDENLIIKVKGLSLLRFVGCGDKVCSSHLTHRQSDS